jgi:hypothetical protein
MLRTSSAGYISASQACINIGGALVMYKDLDEQLLVERYFSRTRWVCWGGWAAHSAGGGAGAVAGRCCSLCRTKV